MCVPLVATTWLQITLSPAHAGVQVSSANCVTIHLNSTNEHRSFYKRNSARVTVMSLIPYQSFTQWMLLGDSPGLKSPY